MEFNAGIYELGERFTRRPLAVYHLVLPGKLRMKWLVLRNVRAARRQPASVRVQLIRPLNKKAGYVSVTKMCEQDYSEVLRGLQGYFGAKSLTVSNLELKYLRKIAPDGDFQEPHDLVEATFTVGAQ